MVSPHKISINPLSDVNEEDLSFIDQYLQIGFDYKGSYYTDSSEKSKFHMYEYHSKYLPKGEYYSLTLFKYFGSTPLEHRLSIYEKPFGQPHLVDYVYRELSFLDLQNSVNKAFLQEIRDRKLESII